MLWEDNDNGYESEEECVVWINGVFMVFFFGFMVRFIWWVNNLWMC